MSRRAANDTLKNVLAACNIDSKNINFDLLVLKGLAQTNLVDACKWIAIGFLFLILIAPVSLLNSDIRIESGYSIQEHIIIQDHRLYSDHFTLLLRGDDIEYDKIFALNKDGVGVFPTSVDPETGLVTFPYDNESLTIYISDKHGHSINAVLSEYAVKEDKSE